MENQEKTALTGVSRGASAGVESERKALRHHAELLCAEHPLIATGEEIFGGVPHLKGRRLPVSWVLGTLYTSGSIESFREHRPDVSEEEIKEALAYAQDLFQDAMAWAFVGAPLTRDDA